MDTIVKVAIIALLSPALAQHYNQGGGGGGGGEQDQYNYNRQPPPQILSHKQALNHDGNFKYLFTSENGLAQGESIAPDGSRNGGYSYVDPNGRKISVKYTAGKEGFRILEADHLPKAPQPVAPPPQQAAYQGRQDDGQYRPEYEQRQQQHYERPQQHYERPQQFAQAPRPAYQVAQPQQAPLSNAIGDQREPEYNDAPGKPYSFGTGYVFEFGG